MSIAKAVSELMEPEFTAYQQSAKIPTEEAVEALQDKYGIGGSEGAGRVRFYLVEVELGVLRDAFANPPTFPAAKLTYLSASGQLLSDTVRAKPTTEGELEPTTGVVPVGFDRRHKGQPASEEVWETYKPVLRDAHGVSGERRT
jgi:hypothetical protein